MSIKQPEVEVLVILYEAILIQNKRPDNVAIMYNHAFKYLQLMTSTKMLRPPKMRVLHACIL